MCGKCECKGPVNTETEIFFSGDFCEIASKSDKLTNALSMCDLLAPCVKKDVFPDDDEREVWEEECNTHPVTSFYKCSSVFEDDELINDDAFRTRFGEHECNPEKFPVSTHLEQCEFVHNDCPLKFWHDRAETYKMDTE